MEPRILERPAHPISRRDIDPNVLKVLYRLIRSGHLAYLVGGSVRDLMLGRRPKDFDVATSAHPAEVRALFRNSRLIGRRFRLAHVFFGRQNIEVATFRRISEQAVAGGDPMLRVDNTFGTEAEDAWRRDFTVNSLFYDPRSFRVIDYTGGVEDLAARLIRSIGDPALRMREDPVRMIRAVRFSAKLGFEIGPATRGAIERWRGELLKASVPRLVEETYRTLGQPFGTRALVLMEELGLLRTLMPWLSKHLSARSGRLEDTLTVRNMAALGAAISSEGATPPHWLVLAALCLDFYRQGSGVRDGRMAFLIGELRGRGFARGDTEHMRLLLEAFDHLVSPSGRTRRIRRRSYFDEARRFFEMMAANYGADVAGLDRFLNSQPRRSAAMPHAAPAPRRRRRRRRRHRGPAPAGQNRFAPRPEASAEAVSGDGSGESIAARGDSSGLGSRRHPPGHGRSA